MKKSESFWNPVKKKQDSFAFTGLRPISFLKSPSQKIKSKNSPISFMPKKSFDFGITNPALTNKKVKKKNMNWKQAKSKYPRLNPFADADKDGVANIFDCKPFDKRRQGGFHKKSGFGLTEMYEFAQKKPGKTRTKSIRDVIYRDPHTVAARLWNTDVATLNPKTNVLTVRTSGWQTKTTKERINKALPEDVSIVSRKGSWMVSTPRGEVPFQEGMEIEVEPSGKRGRIRVEGEERVMPGYKRKKVIPIMTDDETGHAVSFKSTNYERKKPYALYEKGSNKAKIIMSPTGPTGEEDYAKDYGFAEGPFKSKGEARERIAAMHHVEDEEITGARKQAMVDKEAYLRDETLDAVEDVSEQSPSEDIIEESMETEEENY
jgi:hypothetical protein